MWVNKRPGHWKAAHRGVIAIVQAYSYTKQHLRHNLGETGLRGFHRVAHGLHCKKKFPSTKFQRKRFRAKEDDC
eukprot:gene10691-biopygen262